MLTATGVRSRPARAPFRWPTPDDVGMGRANEQVISKFHDCPLPEVCVIVLPALFCGKALPVFIGDHDGY